MKKKITKTKVEQDFDSVGADSKFVGVASREIDDAIDTGLGLKLISIRMPEDLLDDLKMIADYNNTGYQPLIRDVLKRYAHDTCKKMAVQLYEKEKQKASRQKKTA